MNQKTKLHIFISVFLISWMSYFVLPCLMKQCPLIEFSNIFKDEAENFMVVITIFILLSVGITCGVDIIYKNIKKLRWFRPKIGQLFIREGYIIENQLEEALREQKLRIGETLVKANRITYDQLKDAIAYQQKNNGIKLGEILVKNGSATYDDIRWALKRMKRKLGGILVDLGYITDSQLNIILGRIWYPQYWKAF
jgi:hypothetical protein